MLWACREMLIKLMQERVVVEGSIIDMKVLGSNSGCAAIEFHMIFMWKEAFKKFCDR